MGCFRGAGRSSVRTVSLLPVVGVHASGLGALTEPHRWEETDTALEAAESKVRVLAGSVPGESVPGLCTTPCCVLTGTFFRSECLFLL